MRLRRYPTPQLAKPLHPIPHAKPAVPSYTVHPLGGPGMTYEAGAISQSGRVVGTGFGPTSDFSRALDLFPGGSTDLGSLGGLYSTALGLNDKGDAVGFSMAPAKGAHQHAVLYSGGKVKDLGTLGGKESLAIGINNHGFVTGVSDLGNSKDHHAFIYCKGKMHDIGTLGGSSSYAFGINDAGQVVGESLTGHPMDFIRGFIYWHGVLTDLGTLHSDDDILPSAINAAGQVVGDASSRSGSNRAFLYSAGAMTDLGALYDGDASHAYGLNDRGDVVGASYGGPSGFYTAFLYSGGVMKDLNTMIDPAAGWMVMDALHINNAGQILARGFGPGPSAGGYEVLLLNPVKTCP